MAVTGPPMLTQEQCVETRMFSRQGKSIRGGATEFVVSRNTVWEHPRSLFARATGKREHRRVGGDRLRPRASGAALRRG